MAFRAGLICLALMIVVAGFYGLAFGRIVINGSHSLTANGFLMFSWPRIPWRGSIVALKMPAILAPAYAGHDGLVYVKVVTGLPGDPVRRTGDTVCIQQHCARSWPNHAGKRLELWQAEEVPPGHIAVLGQSRDSLDSRYAVIGAIPVTDILAVGIVIPFPHWTRLKAWLT